MPTSCNPVASPTALHRPSTRSWRLTARLENHLERISITTSTPFESSGDKTVTSLHDYHSSNTEQLNVAGVKSLLLRLPEIQSLLGGA